MSATHARVAAHVALACLVTAAAAFRPTPKVMAVTSLLQPRGAHLCAQHYPGGYQEQHYSQQGGYEYGWSQAAQPEPKYVQAEYDNLGHQPGELGFRAGDVIQVTQQGEDGGWWEGLLDGQYGWFPSTFCAPYYTHEAQNQQPQQQDYSYLRRPRPVEHDVYDPRSATQTYEQWLQRAH